MSWALLGAGTALICTAALHEHVKAQHAKDTFYHSTTIPSIAKQTKHSLTSEVKPGKRRLYFDECDEMVDEATALKDPSRYHIVEITDTSVKPSEIVTKQEFAKENKKCENAQIFIEKLHCTKQKT